MCLTFVKNNSGSVGRELEVPNSYDTSLKEYEENGMSKSLRWKYRFTTHFTT